MSRFPRLRRRPDHWASAHARARARAAERLDGPLGLAESTWLDEHLSGCAACSEVAAAYEDDRAALQALRGDAPVPPRDLWARTAAGIEAASGGRGRAPATAQRQGSRIPLGALSGIAVIAVVVGVSAVSGGLFNGSGGAAILSGPGSPAPADGSGQTDVTAEGGSSGGEPAGAAPTPLAVGAGDVKWIRTGPDGDVAFNAAAVREVCPIDSDAQCATLDDLTDERLALTAAPKSIISSPTTGQAVVVTDDGAGGERITVLALPERAVDGSAPSPTPAVSPSAAPLASAEPTATPEESADPSPSGEPAPTPSPSTPAATDEPAPTAAPILSPSPEPTVAADLAIASDIAVVGESAAFSPDGTWFAFTARPLDGSTGPDVYVWQVGAESAQRLTSDGRTYFASWDGDTVIASRPAVESSTRAASPSSVAIDPLTGEERSAGDLWHPVVDPTGQRAVAWAGTVTIDRSGTDAEPADGRLELRSWSLDEPPPADAIQVVTDAAGPEFDVRWDETGEWFAIWVADPASETLGRLSLYRVDPTTGLLEHPEGAPAEVPALPGFSIGEGRLAWVTPPGQGGEGSRVQIVAWAPDGVGSVETAPGEDVIVVR